MRTGVIAVLLATAVALLVGAPAGARVQQSSLTVKVKGEGRVIGTEGEFTAIDCPGDCEDSNEGDVTIDLRAIPDPGWHFEGWSGACSGRDPECTLFVEGNQKVTATF